MENKEAEVRLTGRWQLTRKFVATATEQKNLTVFRDQEYVVEFQADSIMTESSAGETTAVAYRYDPATKTISIQQSDRRQQPSPISAIKSTFRVVPLNEKEIYLMSPPSIEVESDEFDIILLERIE